MRDMRESRETNDSECSHYPGYNTRDSRDAMDSGDETDATTASSTLVDYDEHASALPAVISDVLWARAPSRHSHRRKKSRRHGRGGSWCGLSRRYCRGCTVVLFMLTLPWAACNLVDALFGQRIGTTVFEMFRDALPQLRMERTHYVPAAVASVGSSPGLVSKPGLEQTPPSTTAPRAAPSTTGAATREAPPLGAAIEQQQPSALPGVPRPLQGT